ncbi:MAG TPA: tetratricopeptide repeat protein [Armatimonadota bacterium]|jgi:tetratricopeptide (TPR) repeat protein
MNRCKTLLASALLLTACSQPVHADVQAWEITIEKGNASLRQNHIAEAEKLFRLALKQAEATKDPMSIAVTANNVGEVLYRQKHYAQAEPFYRRSLQLKEKALGKDDRALASVLGALADTLAGEGKKTEAGQLRSRASALLGPKPTLSQEQKDKWQSLSDAGKKAVLGNNLAEADRLHTAALAIVDKADPNGLRRAVSLQCLGEIALKRKDYAVAERLLTQALDLKLRIPDSKSTAAITMGHLAGLYYSTGKVEKCIEYQKNAIWLFEDSEGKEAKNTVIALENLAVTYQDLKRAADEEPLLKRLLAITEKQKGMNSVEAADRRTMLAAILVDQGKLTEAFPLLTESVSAYDALHSKASQHTARALDLLALCYARKADWESALPAMRRAVVDYETVYGKDDPQARGANDDLKRMEADAKLPPPPISAKPKQ